MLVLTAQVPVCTPENKQIINETPNEVEKWISTLNYILICVFVEIVEWQLQLRLFPIFFQ